MKNFAKILWHRRGLDRVKLHGLNLKFWSSQDSYKLRSLLGIPLVADKVTQEKYMLKYARLLVDMKLNGEFPSSVTFVDDQGLVIDQEVDYEWKHIRRSKWSMYVHIDEYYMKDGTKKKQLIHCKVASDGGTIWITIVYGSNDAKERRTLWAEIKELDTNTNDPYFIDVYYLLGIGLGETWFRLMNSKTFKIVWTTVAYKSFSQATIDIVFCQILAEAMNLGKD
ncbi:hypothetical protein Cgig2_013541 [Carnegiea gigantea]|uniref:Uncharacterized protein n=1 Tax=Carnegiea gigantea TaxID=171969 RepID=A0A9Q1Q7V2_9CARY|nr:hypothetical protein Cgig2_013541 [Carnegiea gigantea]